MADALNVTAAERKIAQQAAAAAAPAAAAAAAAAQKLVVETHFWRLICSWASSTDQNRAETQQACISAPVVGLIDEAALVAWETALHAKGFPTVREGRIFTVGLPA
jgi:hypothetical protein